MVSNTRCSWPTRRQSFSSQAQQIAWDELERSDRPSVFFRPPVSHKLRRLLEGSGHSSQGYPLRAIGPCLWELKPTIACCLIQDPTPCGCDDSGFIDRLYQ